MADDNMWQLQLFQIRCGNEQTALYNVPLRHTLIHSHPSFKRGRKQGR